MSQKNSTKNQKNSNKQDKYRGNKQHIKTVSKAKRLRCSKLAVSKVLLGY